MLGETERGLKGAGRRSGVGWGGGEERLEGDVSGVGWARLGVGTEGGGVGITWRGGLNGFANLRTRAVDGVCAAA